MLAPASASDARGWHLFNHFKWLRDRCAMETPLARAIEAAPREWMADADARGV
ncbi:hypothetical protein [Sorangium sp. So ce341]|uniref:hypothetical protein n=1 Tax=Sorangium sp. So ce341 TaxID=3133302 RepID=UPI003F61ECC1